MTTVRRLKKRPEFLAVAAARRKYVAPGLILQSRPQVSRAEASPASPAAEEASLRVGFTVSRKVGKAVERNRARRRLRAAAAEVLPAAAPGFDFVVIGRRETLTRPFGELVQDLRRGVAKAQRSGPAAPDSQRRGAGAAP